MTLINANLMQAFDTFIAFLTNHNPDRVVLSEMYQEKLARLDQDMDVLIELASAGMEEQLAPLLTVLLQEWAIKEAIELLLRPQGCVLDPADKEIEHCFWNKLCRQHQALSSELLLYLHQAKETQEERSKSWQVIAARTFENQQRQQQQWMWHQQQLSQQWFQGQQDMFHQFQQDNRQWATTALTGVQQAQLGMQQWYKFAESTQASVANMLAVVERQQLSMVQEVRKARTKTWVMRLTIIVLVLVGVLALFGFALVMLMQLY